MLKKNKQLNPLGLGKQAVDEERRKTTIALGKANDPAGPKGKPLLSMAECGCAAGAGIGLGERLLARTHTCTHTRKQTQAFQLVSVA